MSTTTPNMNLTVPTVGSEAGPAWATEINGDLSTIDSHNHSSGQGVQIQPNGIDINADLPFNDNNATEIKAARFTAQSAPIPNAGNDVGELYVSGNELYYNDVTGGHQIKMTTNGSVNGAAGTISGLPSGTASAAYNAGTFTFEAATNTAANMDFASAILRNSSANSKGLTLQPPSAMAANITETLPAIPSATGFMQIDTSGNMSAPVAVSGGITSTNIAAGGVSRPNLVSVGQQVSLSSGSFTTTSTTAVAVTNLSVTITTSGRPVMLMLSAVTGNLVSMTSFGDTATGYLYFHRGATQLSNLPFGLALTGVSPTSLAFTLPPSAFSYLDTPSAGTYTYSVYGATDNSAYTLDVADCVLVAYEL